MPENHRRPSLGSQPRSTARPTEFRGSRGGEGNPFVEGLTGISIVALVALVSVIVGGVLAILISLLY